MKTIKKDDNYWMELALEEAKDAMSKGELPVAAILVSKDTEITRAQTQVIRKKSIAAHGELFALLEAKDEIYTKERPLKLYTTLEPCLMCLGAAIQCGIDEIIYSMRVVPNGASEFIKQLEETGQKIPSIRGGVLSGKEIELMKEFYKSHPGSFGAPYAKSFLAGEGVII